MANFPQCGEPCVTKAPRQAGRPSNQAEPKRARDERTARTYGSSRPAPQAYKSGAEAHPNYNGRTDKAAEVRRASEGGR